MRFSFYLSARSQRLHFVVLWTLFAVFFVSSPGCSCFQKKTAQEIEEEKKKKLEEEKKKPKKDFEVGNLEVLPATGGEQSSITNQVKPGHWVTTRQRIIANNYEFQAELNTAVTNSAGVPMDVERTNYTMRMSRPAPLPKEQEKYFENVFYVPRKSGPQSEKVWLESKLVARGSGREVSEKVDPQPTTLMPDHVYFFLVLADRVDGYGYLKTLPSIIQRDENYPDIALRFYQLAMPQVDGRAPIPSHPLSWSGIAYVIWDNLDPSSLLPDQQQALLDWLHWGGQLIVSGPRSIDSLKGSFLDSYLPADPIKSTYLEQSAFDSWNDKWSIASKGGSRTLLKLGDRGPLAIEWKLREGSRPVPDTGGLLVEKHVGRGRIVMSSFSLADRQITTWKNYDNFFNSAILRRPRRQFREDETYYTVQSTWHDYPRFSKDARINSNVRYFSRDIGYAVGSPPAVRYGELAPTDESQTKAIPTSPDAHHKDARFSGYVTTGQSGIAGWNDFSGAADGARRSLKDAAGISVPKAGMVLRVLAIYLVILVPVNWAVFRVIRRVEWAWVAAPIIAIGGGIGVVKVAQLDIGFARSRTEIAILEMHSNYSRAHLTRYTALYTSLSTDYDIEFEDPSALAQPFAIDPNYQRLGGFADTVSLRRERGVKLSDFRVGSNSTGMMHSEQMYPLGGKVVLTGNLDQGFVIENGSNISIQDAAVLQKRDDKYFVSWIGELSSETKRPLTFIPTSAPYAEQWRQSPITTTNETAAKQLLAKLDRNDDQRISADEAGDEEMLADFARHDANADNQLNEDELITASRKSRAGLVSLGRLIDLASGRLVLQPGESRLIGWTDEVLSGIEFKPTTSQVQTRTLVIAHLTYADWEVPLSDVNLLADFSEKNPETKTNPELFPNESP